MSGSGTLTEARRGTLRALADAIAPASQSMPSASSIGLADTGGQIDRVLALRPDLAAKLVPILDSAAQGGAAAFLENLEENGAVDLLVLMEVVTGAYYLAPEVQQRIGYFGQEALSLGRGDIGAEDLLAEMMERPPHWRRTGEERAASRAAAGAR